jgi:hypothetical protein
MSESAVRGFGDESQVQDTRRARAPAPAPDRPLATSSRVREIAGAGAQTYPAKHGAAASERHWESMLALFAATLKA